ncbi:hypothetical protein B0I35DRAFT_172279 [Stachybotrys elegans]|uniref:Uncharacterized protein n=1 Tax=Stachybotrys elegans TaxID=80388 RepID=A0A8K0SWZ7_9HYPO|nr:hypothetical protein B0I35DRAFT_172279 [Stachybotrys elegans]
MKAGAASLAVFSGLAAIVTADALAPADIPFQCATICGPVVELTSLCDVHQPLSAKKRRTSDNVANARLESRNGGAAAAAGEGGLVDVAKRSFSVIRAAPTSFPPELLISGGDAQQPSTQQPTSTTPSSPVTPTPSTPVTVVRPSSSSSSPFSLSLAEPSSGQVQGGKQQVTTTLTIGDAGETVKTAPAEATSVGLQRGADQQAANDNAEEQCVCLNQSFDVARVAALCASCIMGVGDLNNNVNIIVSGCAFPPQQYSSNLDSVVNDVRVVAQRPARIAGEGALVDHSGAAGRVESMALAAVAVASVVLGALVL